MSCELTLHFEGYDRKIGAEAGESLFSALAAYRDFPLDAPCGGMGKCGKCRVAVRTRGGEKKTVLACRTPAEDGMELWAASAGLMTEQGGDFAGARPDIAPEGALGAAFDIGTTTIAASLFELDSGRRLAGLGEGNSQRRCGADVISRISFGEAGGDELLTELVRRQMKSMAERLCVQAGRDIGDIKRFCAAGNTVMEHFVAGLSPAGIGRAPFEPESLFGFEADIGLSAPVYLAPCPAAYVGGDITAGLLAIDADRLKTPFLFIDAGTNGEMTAGGGDGMLCCATAVGPAFEGGEISCGMPARAGAIAGVSLANGAVDLSVIGGGEAEGLCGSGLVDALAVLLDMGAVTESGRLLKKESAPEAAQRYLGSAQGETAFYFTPDVYITSGDIRRLQLAKAAVAAGARTLIAASGVRPERVFLAGGFGKNLRIRSAARIGLIPPELAGITSPVGNSSLAGAERMLLSRAERERAERIRGAMSCYELSGDAVFSDEYMEAMGFEEL